MIRVENTGILYFGLAITSHSVENKTNIKVLLTLKISGCQTSCRSSLFYPFCNELITSGFIPLHNTSQKKKKALCLSVHLFFHCSSFVPLCFLFSFSSFYYFIQAEWLTVFKSICKVPLGEGFMHLCSCISANWNGKKDRACISGCLCWVLI